MGFNLFPVVRLVDHLSRHGFRVWRHSRGQEEQDDEFFVSHGGRVLGQVTRKFGKAVTVTYGKPDRQLLSIARLYGDVFSGAQRSPNLPVGAADMTGKAAAQMRRTSRSFCAFSTWQSSGSAGTRLSTTRRQPATLRETARQWSGRPLPVPSAQARSILARRRAAQSLRVSLARPTWSTRATGGRTATTRNVSGMAFVEIAFLMTRSRSRM